jgi:DNA-binding CsgD family transcriptional regulator
LASARCVTLVGRAWSRVRFPSSIMSMVTGAASGGLSALTAREREVLECAADGRTNAEVAAKLGITTHAVKFHLGSIFRKLGVKNRTEATSAYWRQSGIGVLRT